jgi:hypothetical protein
MSVLLLIKGATRWRVAKVIDSPENLPPWTLGCRKRGHRVLEVSLGKWWWSMWLFVGWGVPMLQEEIFTLGIRVVLPML